MTLELQPLDDLRFQDLVTQARKRIALRCPEWDEHNVSDPGITLIEQFASMIEMLGYRIDRIPERLHIALLRLLDIELAPPVAATVDIDFRLAGPAEREVTIPAHETEVTTTPAPGERPIAFQISETFVIRPLRPVAVALRRGGRIDSLAVSQGVCRPTGPDRAGFGASPAPGDGLYLGFAEPLDRLMLRISVDASKAWGAGIDPNRPPLQWEASAAERRNRARMDGRPRECSRTPPRASTRAAARSTCRCRSRPPPRSVAGRAVALGALPPGRGRAAGAALPPAAADRLDHRARRGRAVPAHHAARVANEELGSQRRNAGPDLPRAPGSGARAEQRGRAARGARAGQPRVGALDGGRLVRGQRGRRPALPVRPGVGQGRARSGDPRSPQGLDAARRGPAQGRDPPDGRLPPRRRRARQRRAGRAPGAPQGHPRRRVGEERRGGARRRRRRDDRRRTAARRARAAHPRPRGDRPGLRVPRRRGDAAGRAGPLRPAAGRHGDPGVRASRRCRTTSPSPRRRSTSTT